MRDLRFSQWYCWGFRCSGMWSRVVWWLPTFRRNIFKALQGSSSPRKSDWVVSSLKKKALPFFETSYITYSNTKRHIPRDLHHYVQVHECYHVDWSSGSQTVLFGTLRVWMFTTERCDAVWVISASYSWGPRFKSRPRYQPFWLRSFMFLLSPSEFWDISSN